MVSEKIKVSQNFGQISRVSQSRLLRGSDSLAVANFFAKAMWGLNLALQSKDHKKSWYRSRVKRWSRRLAMSRI